MTELCGMLILSWGLMFILLFIGSISAVSAVKCKHGQPMNRENRLTYRAQGTRKIIDR